MQEVSARMDRWYHTHDAPIESTFAPDVVVIRHVTDFAYYISMMQCYEVTRDSTGQPWRQSSFRVRVFDPLHNYKLKVWAHLWLYTHPTIRPHLALQQCSIIPRPLLTPIAIVAVPLCGRFPPLQT